MNVRDAAYHLVHDYPGGAEALAPRLGKRATSLSAEVSPNPVLGSHGRPAAKLGLLETMTMMQMSGDHRVLFAMAAELGYLAVPLPRVDEDDHSDAATAAQRLGELAREFADVMGAAVTGLADGRLTDNELSQVEDEWGQLVARGQQLLALFVSLNQAQRQGRGQGQGHTGGQHGTAGR